MTVDISSISDATLRHAAEVADLNDNTANSGKLDQKELSVFIKEAVNSNCNKDAIAEVCNLVGVEHASDDVKASMEKLNQLQKLEKELKYQNNILEKRNDEIKKLKQEDDANSRNNNLKFFGGFVGGAAAGAAAGAAVGSAFAGVGAIAGGIVGGLIGALGGAYVGTKLQDYSSNYKERREFNEQKRPIENKVNELKAQMQEIQKSL